VRKILQARQQLFFVAGAYETVYGDIGTSVSKSFVDIPEYQPELMQVEMEENGQHDKQDKVQESVEKKAKKRRLMSKTSRRLTKIWIWRLLQSS
jgi:hypothetical protein